MFPRFHSDVTIESCRRVQEEVELGCSPQRLDFLAELESVQQVKFAEQAHRDCCAAYESGSSTEHARQYAQVLKVLTQSAEQFSTPGVALGSVHAIVEDVPADVVLAPTCACQPGHLNQDCRAPGIHYPCLVKPNDPVCEGVQWTSMEICGDAFIALCVRCWCVTSTSSMSLLLMVATSESSGTARTGLQVCRDGSRTLARNSLARQVRNTSLQMFMWTCILHMVWTTSVQSTV